VPRRLFIASAAAAGVVFNDVPLTGSTLTLCAPETIVPLLYCAKLFIKATAPMLVLTAP
jgi:hypothetical protein